MKKLYLCRHGETNWNTRKDLKYSEEIRNCGLNENGLRQAKQTAEYLKDKEIQHIYSSIFKRAYQTAQIFAETLNVGFDIIDDVHEFSIYDETVIGLTKEEIIEKVGAENHGMCMNDKDSLLDWRPLNCQTKGEARNRIYNAINILCETTPFEIITITSHGAILRELLRALNYEDDSKLKNCEIIEANYNNNLEIIKRTCYES